MPFLSILLHDHCKWEVFQSVREDINVRSLCGDVWDSLAPIWFYVPGSSVSLAAPECKKVNHCEEGDVVMVALWYVV